MSTTKSNIDLAFGNIPQGWNDLTAMLPLRPIHDEVELENATEVIDAMAGFDLTPDQDDYLDSLSTLVETYEDEHYPIEVNVSGIEVLHSFMDDHQMKNKDLADLLCISRGHASKLLSGDRQLTTTHLSILSKHFRVSADLFIH